MAFKQQRQIIPPETPGYIAPQIMSLMCDLLTWPGVYQV